VTTDLEANSPEAPQLSLSWTPTPEPWWELMEPFCAPPMAGKLGPGKRVGQPIFSLQCPSSTPRSVRSSVREESFCAPPPAASRPLPKQSSSSDRFRHKC